MNGDNMKKKKILICINDISQNSIGNSFINLINRLDYTKYDVDLIYVTGLNQLLSLIPKNVNVINSPFNISKFNLLTKFKYFHRYDMSIMYDLGNPLLCDLIMCASKNNYVYLHKNYKGIYLVKTKYEEFISKYKILKFSKYLFANKYLRDTFINAHSEKEGKDNVLQYVIDEKHIIDMSKANIEITKPANTTLLCFAGSINDRSKNFTLMVKLMADLIKVNNKVKLWIIGDGPDLINVRMLVTQYKLDQYIKLFGFKNNPYPYMALADYYLNTADVFDSSTSIIEAKVLEKPIISTNVNMDDPNIHVVSSDPNFIANDVNKVILDNVKYCGQNNFWKDNQVILHSFDELVN